MENGYHTHEELTVLGGLLLGGGALPETDTGRNDVLYRLGLDREVARIREAMTAGDTERMKHLAGEFLSRVALLLAARLQAAGFPEDTPGEVMEGLATALTVKTGFDGDALMDLKDCFERSEGYLYEERDAKLAEITQREKDLEVAEGLLGEVLDRLPGQRGGEGRRICDRFTFWQAAGYTADRLYFEGLADDFMASSFLREVVRPDLSGLDNVPESCRDLMARTVRLCHAIDNDGAADDGYRLSRIDSEIYRRGIRIPTSEWELTALPTGYLLTYMKLRSGEMGLGEVDASLLDARLCRCAVFTDPDAIAHVPSSLMDAEMAEHALAKGNPKNLQYVPRALQTFAGVSLAVSRNPDVLFFAEPSLVSYSMAATAVMKKPSAIRRLPMENFSEKEQLALAQLAVSRSPQAIAHVPVHLLKPAVTAVAARKDYTAVSLISDFARTPNLMLSLMLVDPRVARYLPKHLQQDTKFMEKAAIIDNGWRKFLPKENG